MLLNKLPSTLGLYFIVNSQDTSPVIYDTNLLLNSFLNFKVSNANLYYIYYLLDSISISQNHS